MKKSHITCVNVCFLLLFISACKENTSSTGTVSRTSLATRSWKGESFVLLTTGQSSRIVKDVVLLFEFKNDGNCTLSQASYSISSISGQWKMENEEKNIVITLQRPQGTVAETLPIMELTSTRFVFGDTTLYGYSLVPL